MAGWRQRLRSLLPGARHRNDAAIYADLRSMVLGLDVATLEIAADEPWTGALVAAMEIGMADATATIVCVADGSVSLYLSSGGGVIGAGEHAAVQPVARRFRQLIAESKGLLGQTDAFPTPEAGEVRFQARIGEDRYTGAAPEAALRAGRHPLSPLYAAGQDVLTEIRLTSE